MTTHILIGTDFSDPSEHAVRAAATWAKALGAKVTLAHALAVPELSAGALSQPYQAHAELEQAVHEHLDAVKERFLGGLDAKTVLVRGGHPAEALAELASSEGVDVIVVGTHGRTGMARLLIGSVAERLVRLARCAVMTVPIPTED